ncbi:Kinesin-like protein klpA [Cytospora mali]|uniref:Kinesin-like protein n=1 Tax=Cytospora mali TaxID=578113 RepID=A0A194ULX7_CYTMA|nr:Kinesin-like protein klpA [Valsa mali var. pyri (nom. inval.)]
MDDRPENAPFRASQLRPPGSRLPAPNLRPGTLNEITDSQNNARPQPSMLPQAGLKRTHTGSGTLPWMSSRHRPYRNNMTDDSLGTVSQLPDAKQRKTLMERAAEYPEKPSVIATPAPRVLNKGVSLASQSGIKPPSTAMPLSRHNSSKSMSSRPPNSFAQSVGPGVARASSMIGRSQTSMSFHQSTDSRPRSNTSRIRPQTSMSRHEPEEGPANGKQNSWDVDERLVDMESQFKALKEVMNVSLTDKKAMEEVIEMAKTRASDLERERNRLDEKNTAQQTEIESMRNQLATLTLDLEHERRSYKYELEDKARAHRNELDELRKSLEDQTERANRQHQEEVEALKRHYRAEIEDEKQQSARGIEELKAKLGSDYEDMNLTLQGKDREIQAIRAEVDVLNCDLDRERTQKGHLQKQLEDIIGTNTTLETTVRSLQAQVHFLESDSKQQSDSFAQMEAKMQEALSAADEARQKLIKEETERRVLFNKYQELKGNIRVMCRVRPVLDNSEGTEAELDFPDEKTSAQIQVKGPEEKNSLGKVSTKAYPFEFDRVFTPQVHNEEIFDEISQLVQSALDGYNVCIFCYGQTGSGKTYTMSSPDGMIPRATKMIYETVNKLKEKYWTYTMEGSFVEVYNEELHDLLASAKEAEGKKKLEIRHDEARRTTTVLNCKNVVLESVDTVELMLKQAQSNRSVAATKANERSSRSHSVFILKLIGENSATGERCEGTLNLVDLAGSERLKHSGAEGDRMKETQNINKSLTCLGNVIDALGKGNGHIPYRDSQLTWLLRNSLGGNSKTLMFVMVSPLEAHLKETLTSLRFATKVHNTHIGTAKATKKIKERNSDP